MAEGARGILLGYQLDPVTGLSGIVKKRSAFSGDRYEFCSADPLV